MTNWRGQLIPTTDLVVQIKVISRTTATGGTYHEAHTFDGPPEEKRWKPVSEAINAYWHASNLDRTQ